MYGDNGNSYFVSTTKEQIQDASQKATQQTRIERIAQPLRVPDIRPSRIVWFLLSDQFV